MKTFSKLTLTLALVSAPVALPSRAHAQPADQAAGGQTAPAPLSAVPDDGRFDTVSIHMRNGWTGDLGTLQINSDGSYAYQRPLREILRGNLTPDQLAKFQADFAKANVSAQPAQLPGFVADGTDFTITTTRRTVWGPNAGLKTWTTSGAFGGAVNAPASAHDAWQKIQPLLTDVNSIYSVISAGRPLPPNPAPAPAPKAPFDEIKLELQNPWTQSKETLTVDAQGNYTLQRSLGQSTLTGTLTAAQFSAIKNAFDVNTFSANNGQTIGGFIPDGTLSTITAKTGGNVYSVNAYVNSRKLGPLDALEKALVGDVSSVQPPVARPIVAPVDPQQQQQKSSGIVDSILGPINKFFSQLKGANGENDALGKTTGAQQDLGRPARTAGLTGLLDARIAQDAGKAKDGADAAEAK